MRNSFNTAGFSEVVHEIRQDPREADYVYSASALQSPRRGLTARVGPALLGSVKSARAFAMDLRDGAGAPGSEPTPMDLALTGVASCALTALVGGGSAKGSVFDSVEMLIEHAGAGAAVRCHFDVAGALEEPAIRELVDQVCDFSPNFTSMTQPLTVDLRRSCATGQGPGRAVAHRAPQAPDAEPSSCRVRWISGTQFESRPLAPGGALPVRVDSPKQLTGVDWGPNPQEHLLMGLAADLAVQAARLGEEATGQRLPWHVHTQAKEDVRGLLQTDASVVVHLQDVRVTVSVPEALSAHPDIDAVVASAFGSSPVAAFLRTSQPVDVTVQVIRH
ncbi:hypothetical protein AQJ23_39215 [Streptomyces antibioticus]|nr:OsmC family protein [Streptomyces antibioticus]KUN18770.1 hypothetical protein AQJ23_39215 [Streptomyces antibioticus]